MALVGVGRFLIPTEWAANPSACATRRLLPPRVAVLARRETPPLLAPERELRADAAGDSTEDGFRWSTVPVGLVAGLGVSRTTVLLGVTADLDFPGLPV